MFKAGDAIVHPVRGAGVVVRVEERKLSGNNDTYYRIELLGHPGTSLVVPVKVAEKMGVRRAIPRSKLGQVWHVLCDDPKQLPENHKDRYQFLEEKMYTGDILQVAEAVRDMAWRREQEGNLTTRGVAVCFDGK